MSAETLHTIGEAAKILGVSPSTLRRWEKEGKISFFRTLGGHRRVESKVLNKVLYPKKGIVYKEKKS